MAEDQAQRTEPATPKKREDSRRKGQVAQSRDFQSFVVLGAAAVALGVGFGAELLGSLLGTLRFALGQAGSPPASSSDFHAVLLTAGTPSATALLPIMSLIAAVAGLAQLAQVGPLFSFEVLRPRGDRIDPVKGLGRMVQADRWVELAKAILKVVLVSLAAWWAVQHDLRRLVELPRLDLESVLLVLALVVGKAAAAALGLLAVVAVFDVAFQRARYEKQLRMTRQEVREELKQAEGDPQMRAWFRRRQREVSRSRMIAAVATADVVVTNPTHFAVALRYERARMSAPEVVAKGQDHVAQRIREAARSAGVPVHENAPLARLLYRSCELGQQVPEKLFQAVAEVLAFVYKLDAARRGRSVEA